MDLIIVESPTKAKTLSRFLGKDYEVEATLGHIKDLPKSKLGVDVEKNFAPDYQVVELRKKEIANLKKAAKKAKIVYLAPDPDREGEAIASHVKEILDGSETKRIVFHEITKEAVEEAISHPGKVDKNKVDAQIARRVLDRLVGYKLSPLLWKKVRRGLSAGRVQTVAVRLIVEKEREIEKFKPVEYWEIASLVTKEKKKELEFLIDLSKIDGKKAEVGSKAEAEKIVTDLKKTDYLVDDVKRREVKKRPLTPFTTSTMTQTAASLFGWSARKTMTVAQKLYEKGLITYHRTDSVNLAAQAVTKVRDYIAKNYGNEFLPEQPRFYKTKSKAAQEAHEAIRPTNLEHKVDTGDGKKLYDLIWKRFVACQMAESIFDETTIIVLAGKYELRASGQIMKFEGWRKVMPLKISNIEELPEVTKGDNLDLVKVNSEQKFTQPPARYNEASLIKTLEKLGIGRPSTYAPTIYTIQIRNYVEKEDRKFKPTSVGIAVNDFLLANFPGVFDYDFTANMEDSLDDVAQGDMDWTKVLKDFYPSFEKKVVSVDKNAKRVKIEVEKLGKTCPKCGKEEKGELVVRTGRFGKFISCSRFPDCDYTEKYLNKVGMKCPDCKKGDVIAKKTKKGRKFFGCSRYPDCKFASWTDPSKKKEDKEETSESNE